MLLIHEVTGLGADFFQIWNYYHLRKRPAAVAKMLRTGLWIGWSGFDSQHSLTACGLSGGKEVEDVFGRPGARIGVGSARSRPLAAHDVGYPAVGQNWETGQLSRHYIAEISLSTTLNHNQPTNQELRAFHYTCTYSTYFNWDYPWKKINREIDSTEAPIRDPKVRSLLGNTNGTLSLNFDWCTSIQSLKLDLYDLNNLQIYTKDKTIVWFFLAKLNPILWIRGHSAVGRALDRCSWDCWFEPAIRHYFSSINVGLLAYVFTGRDLQLKWLKRNESNRVYWFETRFFCNKVR